MSRPDRWWRPVTQRRPPLRARQRRLYSAEEVADGFEVGYRCGQGDAGKQRQGDDLLDVADAAGATPLDGSSAEQVGDEVERWLRGVDGDGPAMI